MQESNSVEQLHDERQTRKRRSRRFIIALLLTLLLLSLPLLYFSPIGQAWQQSRDMEELSGEEFRVMRFADPTEHDEFWLEFLPREGVLEPRAASGEKDEGHLPALLKVAGKYSSWQDIGLTISRGSEDAVRERLEQWENLKKLMLWGDFDSSAIPSLQNHDALKMLLVSSPDCDSQVLPKIASASLLEALYLWCPVSDEGLTDIIEMPSLQWLHLSSRATVSSAPFIEAEMPAIEVLWVHATRFDDAGCAAVLNWPKLRNLSVLGCSVTDTAFNNISAENNNLVSLQLRETQVTSAVLPAISQFLALEYLGLTNTDIGDGNLESLNELKSLATLDLPGTKITTVGLRKLQLAALESITFPGERVTVDDVADLIRRNPNLWNITISDSTLTEEDQRRLDASYPNINFLFYRDND